MTNNAYLALLGASLKASTTDEGLNFYDSQHRFEHSQLLLFTSTCAKDFLVSRITVIFSRLDPGEKLVIGCRKATIYAETQDAKLDRLKQLLKETEKYLQKFGVHQRHTYLPL
uniref:Uncharacterized protein n=1 Tax=Lactuca sativa TaxID=4236 RepID=A0A9R1V3K9_LACSA|nr:hypothetical protein LSAT_V11C700364200 [Lactuca sativa]